MLLVYHNNITEASWDGDEMEVNGNENPSCVTLNVISDCIVLLCVVMVRSAFDSS